MSRHLAVIALAAVAPLLGLRFGGYHMRHAGWVVLVLVVWASYLAARGRLTTLRSPFGIAGSALMGLVLWSCASIAWAEVSTHDAWVEAARAAGYAAMFLLGGALLANARSYARFVEVSAAALSAIALVALGRMLVSEAPLKVFAAGRLDWPVGYAPGTAAACSIAALLLLGVSCAAEQRWLQAPAHRHVIAGAGAMAAATMCSGCALLAQSRGALVAMAAGLLVSAIAVPTRGSWLARTAIMCAALAGMREQLAAPFRAQFDLRQAPFTPGANEQALLAAAEESARDAAAAILIAAAVVALATVFLPAAANALRQRRAEPGRRSSSMSARVPVVLFFCTALLLAIVDGRPSEWISRQWSGCVHPAQRPDDPGSSESYFANAGTGRCDYYRVAINSFRDAPLLGSGAGNFRGDYARERRTNEEPRVAHSLPLSLLGELGIIGALLGATVLACVTWACARFVRSGPMRDATFAGAVGAIAYWTAHASIDWLWQLPVATLAATALAGGLLACLSPAQRRTRAAVAAPFALAACIGAFVLIVPVTLADAELRRARDVELERTDPRAALHAARTAATYDPNWAAPALIEAQLLAAGGDSDGAARAARRAIAAEPASWSVQWQAASLLTNHAAADRARNEAHELNPRLDVRAARQQAPPDSMQNPRV